MTAQVFLDLYLRLVVQALPVLVLYASGRRLLMSQSGNAALYAVVFIFAAAAAIGVAPGVIPGNPVSLGASVMAFAALPLWLVVREQTRRPEDMPYERTVRPVFATRREREERTVLLLPPAARTLPPASHRAA